MLQGLRRDVLLVSILVLCLAGAWTSDQLLRYHDGVWSSDAGDPGLFARLSVQARRAGAVGRCRPQRLVADQGPGSDPPPQSRHFDPYGGGTRGVRGVGVLHLPGARSRSWGGPVWSGGMASLGPGGRRLWRGRIVPVPRPHGVRSGPVVSRVRRGPRRQPAPGRGNLAYQHPPVRRAVGARIGPAGLPGDADRASKPGPSSFSPCRSSRGCMHTAAISWSCVTGRGTSSPTRTWSSRCSRIPSFWSAAIVAQTRRRIRLVRARPRPRVTITSSWSSRTSSATRATTIRWPSAIGS